MKLLVMGGTGRTGRHLLPRLVAAGHEVFSLGRRDPGIAGVVHRPGDVTDPATVAAALDGIEAAVSTLASSNAQSVCAPAARGVIAAAPPGFRLVTVAGAAVDVPGDAKGLPDRAVGGIMRLFLGRMLADRQAEYAALEASALGYVMLRPPRLTDAPGTGRWSFAHDRPPAMEIARADLAGAIVEALDRADLARRAPFVAVAKR